MPAGIDDFDTKHTFRSNLLKAIGDEAAAFFEKTPIYSFPPQIRTNKLGVYGIYYVGNCEYYRHVGSLNTVSCKIPIYIGKAVPTGWRKGRTSQEEEKKSVVGRLREHAGSIRKTTTLNLSDFKCRFMVLEGVEADLITAVEAVLIRRYKPIWNTLIDGFGNHTPGNGRFDQAKSGWDVLHPGRPWAEKCKGVPPLKRDLLDLLESHRSSLSVS